VFEGEDGGGETSSGDEATTTNKVFRALDAQGCMTINPSEL
jgi:hypothetical protein